MKIDINRLKNYLSDLDPDTSIVDEAIATIEAVAENKTDDELYERERPLMIAYLALRIVKAGLNVSPQKDEVHGHWKRKSQRFINKETGAVQAHYIWNECSLCRKHSQYKTDFCPYCGAKMDESEESNDKT